MLVRVYIALLYATVSYGFTLDDEWTVLLHWFVPVGIINAKLAQRIALCPIQLVDVFGIPEPYCFTHSIPKS